MSRRNIIRTATVALAVCVTSAQPPSSIRDPKMVSLNIEGRVPLSSILPNPAVVIPPDVLKAVQSGSLENRGRVEYIPESRVFRIHQLFVSPKTPFPLASAPKLSENSVGVAIDMAIEQLHWSQWKAPDTGKTIICVTASGRTIKVMKGPAGIDEYGVLQFAFERDNPNAISMLSLSYAGGFVAWSSDVKGAIQLASTKTTNQ